MADNSSSSNSSSANKDAELAAAEVAAILAAAPNTGAKPSTGDATKDGGAAAASASRIQQASATDGDDEDEDEDEDEDDDDEEDDEEDVEMNDAGAAAAQSAANALADVRNGTAMQMADSSIGRGRSSSPLSSGSLSNLSSPTSSSMSLPDDDGRNDADPEAGPAPRPGPRSRNGRNEDEDDGSSEDDGGSSDISDPAPDERGEGRLSEDEDDDDEDQPAHGGHMSPDSRARSDDGQEASDSDLDDDDDNDGAPTSAAAASAAQAHEERAGAAGATVVSDSSDLGSPESIAETEPLPFEDSHHPGAEGPAAEEEDDEQLAREGPTPSAAAQADGAKDDREEVMTATPQEAMEALTRIEIQFAMLRDRLYVERMEEVCRETEMVLEGTHPELIRFTRAIDQLRERRLRLLDLELEKQVHHYEQVAEGEEQVIWNSYRYQAADLRQTMMNDTARKRRRLEREKRLIDVPRPARRHQTFETELVPNPDRQYSAALRARRREIAVADATAAVAAVSATNPEAARRAAAVVQQLQEGAADDDANDYVAYPEVKGLDDGELWSDLDRMGILPYNSAATLQQYYSPEELQGPSVGGAGPSGSANGPDPYGYAAGPSQHPDEYWKRWDVPGAEHAAHTDKWKRA
ncbi:hypothetical protein OC842_000655 [Tilletia horrida]|uniref:Transcriptional regulatory protein DEP1 n=1 Tax=Tilletia horrida TaxID=155126 RepID=A0AAN6JMK9_9BASI|nr:hypothetical protein OC842_000655 [Tilletia horrida]